MQHLSAPRRAQPFVGARTQLLPETRTDIRPNSGEQTAVGIALDEVQLFIEPVHECCHSITVHCHKRPEGPVIVPL